MPGISYLIKKWGKLILAAMFISILAVGIITFIQPKQFLSTATAVPASSMGADKSSIFNQNVQALYSALGTADDLDLVVGTGNLDTVYLTVAEQFKLGDHYKMGEKGGAAINKAANILKKNTKVQKTGYGELKVKVWDSDKELAAQLANAIIYQLSSIHQHLHSVSNLSSLKGLQTGKQRLQSEKDSAGTLNPVIQSQLEEYEKLIGQYQLIVDTKPTVLIIVEHAKASDWPDKPKRKQVLIATAILSLLFSLLAVLVLERNTVVKNEGGTAK